MNNDIYSYRLILKQDCNMHFFLGQKKKKRKCTTLTGKKKENKESKS